MSKAARLAVGTKLSFQPGKPVLAQITILQRRSAGKRLPGLKWVVWIDPILKQRLAHRSGEEAPFDQSASARKSTSTRTGELVVRQRLSVGGLNGRSGGRSRRAVQSSLPQFFTSSRPSRSSFRAALAPGFDQRRQTGGRRYGR